MRQGVWARLQGPALVAASAAAGCVVEVPAPSGWIDCNGEDPPSVIEERLEPSGAAAGGRFGASVAVAGGTVVVGAPGRTEVGGAIVFSRRGFAWAEEGDLAARSGAPGLGEAVATSGDLVVAGAPEGGDAGEGAAHVYLRFGAAWAPQARLVAPDGAPGDRFGAAVAVSGSTIAVGAPRSSGGGGLASGAVYVFALRAGAWVLDGKLTAEGLTPGDQLGASVAVSAGFVAAGAPYHDGQALDAGAAYVFVRGAGGWAQEARLTAREGRAGDELGASMAASGGVLAAGAPGEDEAGIDAGAAYVFARAPGGWTEQATLVAEGGRQQARLGASVGVSGPLLVAGAPFDGLGGDPGAAYVFVRCGQAWSQRARISALGGAPGDRFGASVGVSGSAVVVGAPGDEARGAGAGAAYVLTPR